MYFSYGTLETEYLSARDERMAEAISRIGHIDRATDPDLFSSVVRHIIGQQVSTKAQATVWARFTEMLGTVTPQTICSASREQLQRAGITFRKADYIQDFAEKVQNGTFDLETVPRMEDPAAIQYLSSLRGIGVWTAEMILLFCLQRPDIFSVQDLAIRRGLKLLYRQDDLTPEQLEAYRKRYSPYGSVASLYLWAIAGGQ